MEIVAGPRAPLYHGTDVMSAARILLADGIKATASHVNWQPALAQKNQENPEGVSLTRSFRFAVDWKGGAGVVFELDGTILAMRYKMVPIDYYQDRHEYEQFLIGSIHPLSAVLRQIYMTEETRNYCLEYDEDYLDTDKSYQALLSHPLLKVIKFPGQSRYFNVRKMTDKMF